MSDSTPAARTYDLYSQAMKNDPYLIFDCMRQADPVFSQVGIDGQTTIWFLTRYDDVELLLRDDHRFVRDQRNALPAGQNAPPEHLTILLNSQLLNKDGAEHRRLRNLVSK